MTKARMKRVAVGIILAGALAFMIFGLPKEKQTLDPIAIVCDPGKERKINDLLVTWVYDHSTRISRTSAQEIVFEATKTKKPLLILALIAAESEFTPTAVSSKGALGLTQVMPGPWEKDLISHGIIKERRDLFDIGPSIAAGNYVLGLNLKSAKGDVSAALEMYLGGRDGAYVKRIFSNLANLYVLVEAIK